MFNPLQYAQSYHSERQMHNRPDERAARLVVRAKICYYGPT